MSVLRRCSLPTDAGPCGRTMLASGVGGLFCPAHDRETCNAPVRVSGMVRACGTGLVKGVERNCPQCGAAVDLASVLKRGTR